MAPVSSSLGKLSRIRDLFFLLPQAVMAVLVWKQTDNVLRVDVVAEVEMKNNFGRLKNKNFVCVNTTKNVRDFKGLCK